MKLLLLNARHGGSPGSSEICISHLTLVLYNDLKKDHLGEIRDVFMRHRIFSRFLKKMNIDLLRWSSAQTLMK